METVSYESEAARRIAEMLDSAMGEAIKGWLQDPAIAEVMLNPDGRLWIDRLAGGLSDTGKRLSAEDGGRIVRVIAHHVGAEVTPSSPRLSAELPGSGERFEGLIPPIVEAPAFAIRKPAIAVFTLGQYADAGIMTAKQAETLCDAVSAHRNILVAGGTSTGKTTLVNALLAQVAWTADRVILIEDTRELQCQAPNLVALRTKAGVASLSDLVRSALRLRPDRIPVGEVRGPEAIELIKAVDDYLRTPAAKAILDEYTNARFYVAAGYEILTLKIKDTSDLHFKDNYRLLTVPLDETKLAEALTVLEATASAYQSKFPNLSRDAIFKNAEFRAEYFAALATTTK